MIDLINHYGISVSQMTTWYVPFVVITFWDFYWSMTYHRRVPLMEQVLHTLPEHLSSPLAFTFISGVLVHVVTFHVSSVLVPCCDLRYDFRVKTMFGSSSLQVVLSEINALLTLFVFIYVFWCPTWFPCQMMLVLI